MEKLASSISQYVDPDRLQQSVPEYLWFVIAVLGIAGFFLVMKTMINFLISNLKELKIESAQHSEEIAAIHQTLIGIKEILTHYGNDIREIRAASKRSRGQ